MPNDLPAGPLVSTDWLAAHLDHPRLRIIDIRGQVLPPSAPKPHYLAKRADYEAGHIPGASFVDWTHDIVDLNDTVPVQLAPPDRIAELFGRLGIADDSVVIAYDDSFATFAGRLLWVLRSYGHEAARVLDGGWVKWLAEGRPVTQDVQVPPPAVFTPRLLPQLRRTAEQLLAGLAGERALNREPLLLDARSPAEYAGTEWRATRGGHIPGATNVFYRDLVSGPNQTFAPTAALRQTFVSAGVDLTALDDREVVAYCNGGVSATATALGLELATGRRAAIYDGSWNEWGNDPAKPAERG